MRKYYRANDHWGKHLWVFIHNICIVDFYDPIDNLTMSNKVYDNLKALETAIPCRYCRDEWNNALKELDNMDLRESMCLFKWSWELHNKINRKLKKNELSYEEALQLYTKMI